MIATAELVRKTEYRSVHEAVRDTDYLDNETISQIGTIIGRKGTWANRLRDLDSYISNTDFSQLDATSKEGLLALADGLENHAYFRRAEAGSSLRDQAKETAYRLRALAEQEPLNSEQRRTTWHLHSAPEENRLMHAVSQSGYTSRQGLDITFEEQATQPTRREHRPIGRLAAMITATIPLFMTAPGSTPTQASADTSLERTVIDIPYDLPSASYEVTLPESTPQQVPVTVSFDPFTPVHITYEPTTLPPPESLALLPNTVSSEQHLPRTELPAPALETLIPRDPIDLAVHTLPTEDVATPTETHLHAELARIQRTRDVLLRSSRRAGYDIDDNDLTNWRISADGTHIESVPGTGPLFTAPAAETQEPQTVALAAYDEQTQRIQEANEFRARLIRIAEKHHPEVDWEATLTKWE